MFSVSADTVVRPLTRVSQQLFRSSRLPLDRPSLSALAQDPFLLPCPVRESAVAMRYLNLLAPLDWDHFPEHSGKSFRPDESPFPLSTFAAAYLIKLDRNLSYMPRLRQYLVDHPALVWILGCPLVPSRHFSWGFDVNASLPTARHFSRLLRTVPNSVFQFLLDATVTQIQVELASEIDDFGHAISLDTKHILAWVRENNPKEYVEDRYDKAKQPAGDPDCRLGCKRRRNQRASSGNPPPTPHDNPLPAKISVGEYYWGYASGVVATKVPGWGEFVLAELTLPFDQSDVAYFEPLMEDTERRLGFRPRYGAFDAAFDAFYIYEYFHQEGQPIETGFAAVPLSKRGGRRRRFSSDGLPLCEAGRAMPLKYTFISKRTRIDHERGRYYCPLVYPERTGEVCPIDHKNWPKGCIATLATSVGARIRHELDRESDLYKDVYKQRTATERINSQAAARGIERPKLRNGASIANHNTLIYVLINLHALQRIHQRKASRSR